MARCYQGVALIVTAMLLVVCEAGYYRRRVRQQGYYRNAKQQYYYQNAAQQDDCELQLDSPSGTFSVCIEQGEVCTDVSVPACSDNANDCKVIGEGNEAIEAFKKEHSVVYADECKESSGTYCVYSDVVWEKCPEAKTMEEQICIKLSDGSERCSKIANLVKVAAANDEEVPPYHPSG